MSVNQIYQNAWNKAVGWGRKLVSLRASPRQIAVGFAVGVFIGIFPTFGLGWILVGAIATVWKFNVPAAVMGTFIGNPFFQPLWILLTCALMEITPPDRKVFQEPLSEVMGHFGKIGIRYMIGNFVVSLIGAIASYFLVLHAILLYRRRR